MSNQANLEIDMKSTATKLKIADKLLPNAVLEDIASNDNHERYNLIATSAYYKAEERGFMPGHEVDDWLTAEIEINMPGDKS